MSTKRYNSNAERQAAYRRRNPTLSKSQAHRLCRQLHNALEHLAMDGHVIGNAAYKRNLQQSIEALVLYLEDAHHASAADSEWARTMRQALRTPAGAHLDR